ncbi:hypothetical protein DPMN_001757 [Dreissena polymorpha]|uniref:G-protein coupled receptors family 1 profile domain-containing protein n=1 Tax=Dreissena polymorpha TaxID=45954 RepID=A0A9D4RTC1_DREPO|nr:hypothetical protein DPMN_001757 [Dreissena polymorpha]
MLKHRIDEHAIKELALNTRNARRQKSRKAAKNTEARFEPNQIQTLAIQEGTRKDIRKDTAVDKRQRNTDKDINRKITLMIVLMAVASFLAFTPYFVIIQTTSLKKYEYPWWMALLFHAYVIQSSVNPFIIGSCNSEFRAYVKNILRCRSVK